MTYRIPPIAVLHARFLRGTLTPRELLEQCLGAITQHQRQIRAWVLVDEDRSRSAADYMSGYAAGHAKNRESLPPLLGVPIGIKDIIDVESWPTLAGSSTREGHFAPRDATVVARLRKAGAIILGKTVTTEFACFDPTTTCNPWNLAHTPGGSSSGSAAAVAAGMCVAALGSQTGGSILRPAAFCGVVGFKPAYGETPVDGVIPVAPSLDHIGPLTTCVDDARRITSVMAGRAIPTVALPERLRLATMESFYFEKGLAIPTSLVSDAIKSCRPEGMISPPVPIEEMHRVHRTLMARECAEYHREGIARAREKFSPGVAGLVDEGAKISMSAYATAQRRASEIRQAWRNVLESFDALLLPATAGAAPATLETTGDPRWQSPWSLCGLPAITIPCALTPEGLPLGLQIVAADTAKLLSVAERLEAQLNFVAEPEILRG